MLHDRDKYTFHHCIGVGVIATLAGKWCGLESDELAGLASAGAMHDVGKAFIAPEILGKPGRLTPEEFAAIKRHTILGQEVLAGVLGPESVAAAVALEYHERRDGTGYPDGLKGDESRLESRIVAVADVFHAMTSERTYRHRRLDLAVLAQLRTDGFGLLDPVVVQTFLARMIPSSFGSRVRLSDGRIGRIAFISEQYPERPLIEMDE
ncbi:MAG: HD-GYP domain-containing protein [Methanocella sp.]